MSDFQAGAFTVELVLLGEMSLHFHGFISVQNKTRTWAFLSGDKCLSAIRICICLIWFTLCVALRCGSFRTHVFRM